MTAMYYFEEIDYCVDAPSCDLCSLRFDCDARHDHEQEEKPHAHADETDETEMP